MADTPLDIDAECRQLQEHLRQLTRDREVIFRQFEELTISNRRLAREIEDDDEATFENLGKFEEKKRSLEDKLESLERSLKEKNESIAALDAKVSDFLLQVSTQSNLKADEIERVTGEVAARVQSEERVEVPSSDAHVVSSETSAVSGELDIGRGEGQEESIDVSQVKKKEAVQDPKTTTHHGIEKDASSEESAETKVGTRVSTLKEAAADVVHKIDAEAVVETSVGAVQKGSVYVMDEPGDGTVPETVDITSETTAETVQKIAAGTVKEAVASTVQESAAGREQEVALCSVQERPVSSVQEMVDDAVVTAALAETQEATGDMALKVSSDSSQEASAEIGPKVTTVTVLKDAAEPETVVQNVEHDSAIEVVLQETVSEAVEEVSSEEVKTAIAPPGQDVATKTVEVPTGELDSKPRQESVNTDTIETVQKEHVNQGDSEVIDNKGVAAPQEIAGGVIDRQTIGVKAVESKAEYKSSTSTLPGLPCSGDEVKLSGKGEEESAVKSLKVAVSNAETTLVGLQKQLATSESKSVELKQKLENTLTKNKDLTMELETLSEANEELASRIKSIDIGSEDTAKRIAMLEFNNEHNKNKEEVKNMEISNDELKHRITTLQKEKEDLDSQLKERISVVEEQITREKSDLQERLTKERDEIQQTLTQDKKELEDRLLKVKTEVEESYAKEKKQMVEQIKGLTEIKASFETQITQIEQNNAEMHRKVADVQVLRDKFKALAEKTQTEKDVLQQEYDQLKLVREELDAKVATLKGELEVLQKKVEEELKEKENMQESKATLQHNLTNLQQQVQGLEQTNRKLKSDLIALTTARQELESLVAQQQRTIKTLEDSVAEKEQKLEAAQKENKELVSKVADLNAASKLTEAASDVEKKNAESQSSADEPLDGKQSKGGENLEAALATVKAECQNAKDEVNQKAQEIAKANDQLKKLQEKLRVQEVISGEVEDYRRKIRELESQIVSMEESQREHLKSIAKECETRIAVKEQECQNTLSSAYDQQDSETGALVRQHRELLKEAQEEAREKASALDALKHEYENKMKYEDQLSSLKTEHEVHIREVEQLWKQRAEKMMHQREKALQEEMDGLTQEWNKERRELERLTQVAAAAFRSGSDSVELLKKQVAAQRRELEDVKANHRKEMRELQQLLEIKRRSGKSSSSSKLGMALEEAAEFEYLKNVLYQYMMGKEKQTLAKVLCAVLKFDAHQEQQILEHEEQQNSLQQKSVNGSVQNEFGPEMDPANSV